MGNLFKNNKLDDPEIWNDIAKLKTKGVTLEQIKQVYEWCEIEYERVNTDEWCKKYLNSQFPSLEEYMKVLAYCWSCNKEYDVSKWSGKKYGVKCMDCGGYVISPSGKIKFKIVGGDTKLHL